MAPVKHEIYQTNPLSIPAAIHPVPPPENRSGTPKNHILHPQNHLCRRLRATVPQAARGAPGGMAKRSAAMLRATTPVLAGGAPGNAIRPGPVDGSK